MSLVWQLVKKGVISKERAASLEYEIKNSDKREEEIILEEEIVPEEFLFGLKSQLLKIPLKIVPPEEVSLKALEVIPEESARYYRMVPLRKEDKRLEVGMVYPDDIKAREALEFLARKNKFSYRVFLLTPSNFEKILKKYRTLRREVSRALEELESELKESTHPLTLNNPQNLMNTPPTLAKRPTIFKGVGQNPGG